MGIKKTTKIDFSRKRIAHMADEYYNRGEYISALRFAQREFIEFGGDPDVYARFCDIYEGMGLHGSAINYWFKLLDVAHEDDLPDVYEGLASNYLSIGNERASAYYYNRLIDADETLPEEAKMDIADAFSKNKESKLHFVYPSHLADYSKELNIGSLALKSGDAKRAVQEFEKVSKGAKQYASAKEMQAVAHLLEGEPEKAEKVCLELLSMDENAVRALTTLSAAYLEQGRTEESLALAQRLVEMKIDDPDDVYKVATVCCENNLHEEAYQRFVFLDERMPYDGRTMYFKAVSAYKSGRVDEAERALDKLSTVYPDAEVAKYYLRAIREYKQAVESGEEAIPPELIYFYHLPQEEREARCDTLLKISSCPKDEAQLFGLLALHDGYFAWCFDEMDGADRDLQYLALVTAAHVRADEFLQDVLLDFEVADVLKIETLRMLAERNEDMDVGMTLCHIYKEVPLNRITIGRKKRKKFIAAYAKILSKFAVVDGRYTERIQLAAEKLYRALENANALDLIDGEDDCACAIYFVAGLTDLGRDQKWVASAFDANLAKVHVLLSYITTGEVNENETH